MFELARCGIDSIRIEFSARTARINLNLMTESTAVVLGIDGGGTNTRAVIANGSKVLARAQSGSIKRLRVGPEAAEANLRALLREVFDRAGASRVHAASAGVASAYMPGIPEWITAVFRDFGIQNSEVVGDEIIALDAAFQGGPGILQIAGTGSNTIGRAPSGAFETAGGYSSVLGDQGSGYWIGLHSIREALHAHDRDQPTAILVEVGKLWGTQTLSELVERGNQTPGPDFSALAPLINTLAEAADPVAVKILHQAAQDLADFILLVRQKLHDRHHLQAEVPTAFTGSVLKRMPIVRKRLTELLSQAAPDMAFQQEEIVAVEGAIYRAHRLAATRW
jgi:N-acetylglucosamine kinase-like BadF-type ATPase